MAVAYAVLLVRLLRFHSSLAALNAFQQSNVAFDEFMEVQAWGGADVYCGDQHRFRSFSCELRILASFRMSFTKEKTRAIGASAPGSASAN